MLAAIILSLMGLVLIYLEFFLPGGIFAIGGTLLLLSSLLMVILIKTNIFYFFIYMAVLIFLVYIVLKFALKKLKSNKNIFLESDQEGFCASIYEKDLIGEIGIAFTDLRPSGKIFINKTYYSATSKKKFIEKGSKIQVVDGESANLIVQEFEEKGKNHNS
jgi:membrane-bound ClpP family serine protease